MSWSCKRSPTASSQPAPFPGQPDIVRRYAEGYGELLELPSILVESTAGSFSYRNVPLRIVALRITAARIEAILAKLGPLPQTRLTVASRSPRS